MLLFFPDFSELDRIMLLKTHPTPFAQGELKTDVSRSRLRYAMPILWRFLIGQYVKVLFFCLTIFLTALLMMRLEEIAHFASLGASFTYLLAFIIYQLPYILPIALPISCLISAMLLMQKLSHSHELTALRACGQSLLKIVSPLCLVAFLLAGLNFYIVSELATDAHLATGLLKNELRSINPLLLLHNKHLLRMKGLYFETRGPSRVGEYVQESILAMPDNHRNRLSLLLAKELRTSSDTFNGHQVTLLASIPSTSDSDSDTLVIENDRSLHIGLNDFMQLLQKQVWSLNNDHLRLSLLLVRLQEETKRLTEILASPNHSTTDIKTVKRNINRCCAELLRRLSVALTAFTFTLLGVAFGFSIGRHRSVVPILTSIVLVAFYLASYFIAKNIDYQRTSAAILYMAPHFILITCALGRLYRLNRGMT